MTTHQVRQEVALHSPQAWHLRHPEKEVRGSLIMVFRLVSVIRGDEPYTLFILRAHAREASK